MTSIERIWRERRASLLEAFLVLNLAFLAIDILLAHAVNDFQRAPEWIPFGFSIVGSVALVPSFLMAWQAKSLKRGREAAFVVGALSMAVGLAGLGFHLESHFLREQSIKHLVYTAPFVVPLAYSGIGSLLIFNRIYGGDEGWPFGVAFGALGGYFGNFVLTLCDHAQNGFYHPAEWVAVAASALAVGFVAAAILFGARSKTFLYWLLGVLALQAVIGIAGFFYHTLANWAGDVQSVVERFVHGAPTFAPMLLLNISILMAFAWIDWFGRAVRAR